MSVRGLYRISCHVAARSNATSIGARTSCTGPTTGAFRSPFFVSSFCTLTCQQRKCLSSPPNDVTTNCKSKTYFIVLSGGHLPGKSISILFLCRRLQMSMEDSAKSKLRGVAGGRLGRYFLRLTISSSPKAMTSTRRSSIQDRFWMLRSPSRVVLVTLAHPCLQMRAAALSGRPPLVSKPPD